MACFERCQLLRSIVPGRGRERGIWEEGTVERKGQDGWRGDDYGIDESPTTTTTITTNGPAFPCCIRFHSYSASSLSSPWRQRHLAIKPTCFPAVLASHNDPPRSSILTIRSSYIYIPDFPHLSWLCADFSRCSHLSRGESKKLLFTFLLGYLYKARFLCFPFSIWKLLSWGLVVVWPMSLVFFFPFLFLYFSPLICGVLFFFYRLFFGHKVFPLLAWGVQCLHFAAFHVFCLNTGQGRKGGGTLSGCRYFRLSTHLFFLDCHSREVQ